MTKKKLVLVSIPIGNPLDISARTVQELNECEFVIGEEYKETSKFLKQIGIEKKFELFNEHSTDDELFSLLEKVQNSKSVCLISDSGNPTLEDPGERFVKYAIQKNISISAIPGASALMVALSICGFSSSPFTFVGFLNRENEKRSQEIKKLLNIKHTIIFYETPYRYKKVIQEISKHLPPKREIFLGLNLTCEDEFIFRGKIKDILPKLEKLPKSLPVIVISLEK
ncbi:MAG: 16S rRNA methyltransferase [Leptospiraceae bacterium]|nr:16S rRNA methyltransferase [Leptospiraceae bacterium]